LCSYSRLLMMVATNQSAFTYPPTESGLSAAAVDAGR
jgi:hypothetical protein